MPATITYASSRVTISGPHKEFVGSGDGLVVTRASGDTTATADAGRFVVWLNGGTTATGGWQVRRITSASAAVVYIHDPWVGTPGAGSIFRISSTFDDILTAQPTSGAKLGGSTFHFAGELELAAGAFLAGADQAVEWTDSGSNPMFPFADGCVLNLGQLWGGEGMGRETTNGCRWFVRQTGTGGNSLYNTLDSRSASGPVVNFFGSLIESSTGAGGFLFQRMRGPTRMIGCVSDGPMGGRFHHEASEWVDSRMSGNNNATPAWSIGAVFARPIEGVVSYRNLAALKSYQSNSGTFKGLTFSNNTRVLNRDAGPGSTFNFIDCTEFGDADILGTGGVVNQYRSLNFSATDGAGVALPGAVLRINNKDDATQGAVQVSTASGVFSEVLALRRSYLHNVAGLNQFAPFRIRIRAYGFLWASLGAEVADPIRQGYAMLPDPAVTQSSAVAAAHTGIAVVDHGGAHVAWQGKSWGITVTCNTATNPGLTLDDLKHYLHHHLAQPAAFGGKPSGPDWHNLLPMSGTETQRESYGTVLKGVRVVDQFGNPFPGVTRMQADDGTFFLPSVTYTLTLTSDSGLTGAEVRIYDLDDMPTGSLGTELAGVETSPGAIFNYTHNTPGNLVWLQIMKPGYEEFGQPYTLIAANTTQALTLTPETND